MTHRNTVLTIAAFLALTLLTYGQALKNGFVSFDDIGELLGPETGKLCVALFERKYYGRGPNGDQPAPPPALAVDEKPSRSLTEVKAVDPEAPPCGS